MCSNSQYILLSVKENAQISWCKGCKTYSLVFGTCCLSFTKEELGQFQQVVGNLNESDFNCRFLGKNQALIKNSYAYMGICLAKNDVPMILELIHESTAVNEVLQIIYNQKITTITLDDQSHNYRSDYPFQKTPAFRFRKINLIKWNQIPLLATYSGMLFPTSSMPIFPINSD